MIGQWREAWSALPGNVRGALWSMINVLTFAVSIGAIKAVGQRVPVSEIVLVSVAGQLVVMSPRIFRAHLATLAPRAAGLHVLRVFFLLGGMLTGFYAVVEMPVAESTALSFTKSLFLTVSAALILAERVGVGRWSCTLIGFLGVLVMLRPDAAGVSWPAILAIVSAGAAALGALMTRVLAPTQSAATLIFWQTSITLVVLAPWVATSGVVPNAAEIGYLAIISASGIVGNLSNIMALRDGEASAVAPIEYLRLPMTALVGYYFFAEVPTLWTWIGAAIIVASTLAALRIELNAARRDSRAV